MTQTIDEDQFRRITYERYREHFDHIYALHELAAESLCTYRGFTGDHYHGALVLIFPRAYKSFDSVRRLCEVGSCEDAAVILRCLLNLMVVTRWITRKPQERARRYFAWYWIQMHRDAEKSKHVFPPAWIADIEKNYVALKPLFEFKDKKGNTKMARHWYQPEAHSILDLFKEVGLEKQYEEGYGPLSRIEHSDSTAFFAMVAGSERKEGERKLAVQNDMFVPAYMRNAFQYFADIYQICNRNIPLTDGKKLEDIVAAGIKFYAADMLAKGIPP